MQKDQGLLESYLLRLEKALLALNPSDRAKIILEHHGLILESLEKYPDKTTQELLTDLGSPEKLANHYLLDRGLKTYKPQRNPVWRFFVYSTFSFFVTMGLLTSYIIWKFTPIYKFDQQNNRVIILGGLVDINQKTGQYKILNEYHFVENQYTNSFEGSLEVNREDYDELVINFQSGMMNFETSKTRELSWNCKLENSPSDDFVTMGSDSLQMDFIKTGGSSCTIMIPTDLKIAIDGGNAQVFLNEPEFDTYLELDNGQVIINPNPELDYKYNLRAINGMIDKFDSSEAEKAYELRINLDNGSIIKKQN